MLQHDGDVNGATIEEHQHGPAEPACSTDAATGEREREVLIGQAKASGKSQEIAEKMVEGRMKKYYREVVLLEQTSVIDGETRIADVVANAGKDAGADIALTAFVRFNLGEGIKKEETDFASEVAAQLS